MSSYALSKTLCYISQLAEFKDSRLLPLCSLKFVRLWKQANPFELEWFICLWTHQTGLLPFPLHYLLIVLRLYTIRDLQIVPEFNQTI